MYVYTCFHQPSEHIIYVRTYMYMYIHVDEVYTCTYKDIFHAETVQCEEVETKPKTTSTGRRRKRVKKLKSKMYLTDDGAMGTYQLIHVHVWVWVYVHTMYVQTYRRVQVHVRIYMCICACIIIRSTCTYIYVCTCVC